MNKQTSSRPLEWRLKIQAGIKKAWEDGKYPRKQSPELIKKRTVNARNFKMSDEHKEAIRKKMTGRVVSNETKAKLSKTQLSGPQHLSPESQAKRNKAISLSRIGTHGYGRAKRGRLDHCCAKHWKIKDFMGKIYECDNLAEWCRANEDLFLPDEFPDSKLPLWKRAVGGFNKMQRTDNKGSTHWRGWSLVSKTEQMHPLIIPTL